MPNDLLLVTQYFHYRRLGYKPNWAMHMALLDTA